MDNLKPIIESMLFVSDAPLTVDNIRSILDIEDRKSIQAVLSTLTEEYNSQK